MSARLRIGTAVALATAALAATGIWLAHELAIDRCLDHGGAWDYERAACAHAKR